MTRTRRQQPRTITRTATIVKQEIVAEETIQMRVLYKIANELECRALGTTSYLMPHLPYSLYPPPIRSPLESSLQEAVMSSYGRGGNPSLYVAYYQISQELKRAAETLARLAPPTLPVPAKKKRSRK